MSTPQLLKALTVSRNVKSEKMRFSLVLFFTIILIGYKGYGQNPSDISFYLNSKQIPQSAKDFYNGKFKASDNSKTLSILDSFYTKNSATRPFYFYLASKMMIKSDGALSEALGNSCKEYLEKHPDNVIEFLFSRNKMIDSLTIENWAKAVAGEFLIICEKSEKQCVKKSMKDSLLKTKKENKNNLTAFYQLVEKHFG